ncbi:hypothetical protein NQZ68_012534 [Dissostichus eleginoides]|nr:hypothetical protein NQZ68_012534 [Dissostichus eleginoides]
MSAQCPGAPGGTNPALFPRTCPEQREGVSPGGGWRHWRVVTCCSRWLLSFTSSSSTSPPHVPLPPVEEDTLSETVRPP